MRPSRNNFLISMAIVAGLVLTQGCGASGNSSGDYSVGTGNTSGVTVTNEVSSPADMNVGDIIKVEFSTASPSELDFTGVAEDSQYYLAIGSLDYGYGTRNVRIEGSISELGAKYLDGEKVDEDASENWDSWTAAEAFQQRLYDVGYAMALDPQEQMASKKGYVSGKAAVIDASVSVGDTESLRVLNSLTSMSSYVTVSAEVKCITENVIMYLDTEFSSGNPSDLTDSDIQVLCNNFSDQIATERSWFGDESDVNSDGKVAALMTPQVNRLGSMGGGIITGFFLAADLYSRSSSNGVSNEREIIYTLVPDSNGAYGMVIPKTFAIDNLMTAVLPHEFQHAVSYNQHVFNGGGTPEADWVNEGMSHLTEDLVGYGQENPSRISVFFNNTTSYQLAGSGSPDLGERGAAYLFLRFLYEQHPEPQDFLWALYHSNAVGVANLETAFGGTSEDFDQFGEFFIRWMAAVTMSGRGLSSDTRYVYEPREYNSTTERWQGICIVCDVDDGRGTVLNGPYMRTYNGAESFAIYTSTARFYDVSTVPSVISLNGASTGSFGAVLVRKQ